MSHTRNPVVVQVGIHETIGNRENSEDKIKSVFEVYFKAHHFRTCGELKKDAFS